jgi:mannosyltransferase OCH1-like enzyme
VIPRIIHRIWLGPEPMPAQFEHYGETWRAHNPGWEMRLWTDDRLSTLRRPLALDRARRPGERANVLRYELLRELGGVYVDTDVECLRSIEPLLEGVRAFAGYERPGEVGNAILGGVPDHPAFERAADEAERRSGGGRSSVAATGPRFLTELLAEFPDVTIFAPETFYPYDWEEEPRPASELPAAYAVHHWSFRGREPWDPDEKVDFLRSRVDAERRRKARFRRRAQSAAREAETARERAARAERRLSEIERSLWWRLHPGRWLRRRVR